MKPRQHITPVGAQTTFIEVWRWGQDSNAHTPALPRVSPDRNRVVERYRTSKAS